MVFEPAIKILTLRENMLFNYFFFKKPLDLGLENFDFKSS